MEREQVLTQGRLGGQVKRYHTWPVLHAQTNAEHTWQVMRIWYMIWGPPAPAIMAYLLWHDAGEIVTGDLPFPIKSQNLVIKERLVQLEQEAVARMGGPAQFGYGLNNTELTQAKLCDLIEMYEYGCHEHFLGNAYARPIIKDTHGAIKKLLENLGSQNQAKVQAYVETIRVG